MKFYSVIALIVLFYGGLSAQTERLCYTDSYYPNISSHLLKHQNSHLISSSSIDIYTNILATTKICLPVIVNNVYQTEEQKISIEAIEQQIETLNKDFNANNESLSEVHPYFEELVADIGIEFYLLDTKVSEGLGGGNGINYYKTKVDTFNMNTYPNIKASNEDGLNGFNTKNYINIWVGNIEAGIKGYASMPYTENNEEDGVVVHYKNFGNSNKTLSHEIGHFLGLKHLFGNEEDNCNEDDDVKDTPQTATAYKTCANDNLVSNECNDSFFEYDLTQNFMNLCNDECLKMFTKGQKVKMLYNLLTHRKLLLKNDCSALFSNEIDISIVSLNSIPLLCDDELTLNYEICNVGKADINNFTFELKSLYSKEVETYIAPGQCIEYNHSINISTIRVASFTAILSKLNKSDEELNLRNNAAVFDFRKANKTSLPYNEDFDDDGNWLITENIDEFNWAYIPKDEDAIKNGCYLFKPHPQNELSINSLYSPVFLSDESSDNLDGSKTFTISFNMAYTNATDDLILDDLFIEQSNVCIDSTYQFLTAVNLADAVIDLTTEQLLYEPGNSNWPSFSFDFETATSLSDLNLKLTYVSSSNSHFLIDNFKISTKSQAPLNIQTYISQNKAGFYPNPSIDGIIHFYAERYKGELALVNLYNQTGKLVTSFTLNNYRQVDISNFPNSQYYVTFNWNNKIVTKKLFLLK